MDSGVVNVRQLRRQLLNEIFRAFARPVPRGLRLLLTPLFWFPAHKVAHLTALLDRHIEEYGLISGARWLLPHFVSGVHSLGSENIPETGPLLVVSNHPGAYDMIAIVACLNREDLKIIASDEVLYRSLPHVFSHMILVSRDPTRRISAVRQMLRHLDQSGALLIFPGGIVDADPAVLPGAKQALQAWSDSVEILLHRSPGTRLVVAIASGVLSKTLFRSPIARIPRLAYQRQKLAEFFQVILQMLFGFKFEMTPRVSFSPPLELENPAWTLPQGGLRPVILSCAESTLDQHMRSFYPCQNQ